MRTLVMCQVVDLTTIWSFYTWFITLRNLFDLYSLQSKRC